MGIDTQTSNVRVCLLSPHPLVLVEWERLLSPAGFNLEARRLESVLALDWDELSLPDAEVFVMDAHTPRYGLAILMVGIRERRLCARQVVVVEELTETSVFPLLGLGAKGLLSYSEAHQRLAQALQTVVAGGLWVPRDLLARFIDSNVEVMKRRYVRPGSANLSHREQEVLQGLLKNLANKEIAERLHISERTVKFHVASLLRKFQVRRRAELIQVSA
jgi:DNA-binding NarL/FixJ family response regulator